MGEDRSLCCAVGCEKSAEFEVYGNSGFPEDVTEACVDHVGHLLGTPMGSARENDRWTVIPLAPSPPTGTGGTS